MAAICSTVALRSRLTEPNLRRSRFLRFWTYAGAIVENALADAFFHQELVVGVGEAVRFVPNALQQTQRARVRRQHERQRPARPIDLLVFLRETDDRQFVQAEALEFAARRGELALAAIDDDQVRQADGEEFRIADCGLRIGSVRGSGARRSRAGSPARILLALRVTDLLSPIHGFPVSALLRFPKLLRAPARIAAAPPPPCWQNRPDLPPSGSGSGGNCPCPARRFESRPSRRRRAWWRCLRCRSTP